MWLGLLEIGLTLVDIMVRLDGMVCSRIRLPRVGGYLGQARWGGGYQGHTGRSGQVRLDGMVSIRIRLHQGESDQGGGQVQVGTLQEFHQGKQ